MVRHVREIVLFMAVWPTVLTILTLTELGAFKPSTVAFAIPFLAHGLFTRALTGRGQGWNSLEVSRVAQIG